MNIEEEVFLKAHVDFNKLEKYGFVKNDKAYFFSKNFLNDSFKAEIIIDESGKVNGKVYDLLIEDEYTSFRVEKNLGEFVNKVRDEYISILEGIKENCFVKDSFASKQANKITKYIKEKYQDNPEFLWEKFPSIGVFRNKNNDKWYGIIMNVNKAKLTQGSGEVEVLNVKLEEDEIKDLLKQKGYYEAYHMNKKNWISIILDDDLDDETIYALIDKSYELIRTPEEWIVPANPKYYDLTNCFDENGITDWKQSSDIHVGDIVYIYLGSPFSSLIYKCKALEVNLPYNYKDKYLDIKKVMNLKLIKEYRQGEISFEKLNELGIKAIRGPRKVSKDISKHFN